jgi:hypothetical protein
VAILALLLTWLLLSGGQTLWKKYLFTTPLDQAIRAVKGVESVSLQDKNNQNLMRVNVTLNNVTNLPKTYQALQDSIQTILNKKKYKIILHDHRSPALEHFYYGIQYPIQEAIFTGRFTFMADSIQEQAKAAKVAAQIYVDNQNVYVQLNKNKCAMYIVIPRQSYKQEVI